MEELIGKKQYTTLANGFSTFEVVIACGLAALALTSMVSLVFGSQTMLLDSEISALALSQIEDTFQKFSLRKGENFNTIINSTSTTDFFEENIHILDITQCIKKVFLDESWKNSGRDRKISLNQIFTFPNFTKLVQEPCKEDEINIQQWQQPITEIFPTDVKNATDLDVVGGLAVLSFNSATTSDVDLVLVNINNPENTLATLDIGPGIFAIDATTDYVYAAVNSTSSQLVVIDIKNSLDPHVVANKSLNFVNPFGSFPEGRSVFYYDSKIYVGTKETAGPELHIFNVSNSDFPFEIGWLELTHNVNDISVRDSLVYIASSSDTEEIIVVDAHLPPSMYQVGSFNAGLNTPNDKDGTSIYLIGDKIYLGRKRGLQNNPEFFVLSLASTTAPTELGSLHLNISGGSSFVSSIIVRSDVAFLSTTDPNNSFFVLDVSEPKDVKKISTLDTADSFVGLDFRNGEIYGVGEGGQFYKIGGQLIAK